MEFNQDSFLVQLYVKKVKEGYPRENVPNLLNLQEIVYQILDLKI